jgi:hypothetical protein
VDRGSLNKGDLVFFKTTRGKRIGHVGIYVGNGKFIHASSGGGKVQVNSLNEGYYNRRFVTARRVAKVSSVAAKTPDKPRTEAKVAAKVADVKPATAIVPSPVPATQPSAPKGTDVIQ